MKRIFAMILALVLVCCVLPLGAFAAETARLTVETETKNAKPGEQIEFKILADADACTSFGLVLEYDSSVFEVVEGECTLTNALFSTFDKDKGLAVMFSEATALEGEVGTFVLKVRSDAAAGAVEVSGISAVKNGSAEITSEVEPAKLSIAGAAAQGGNAASKPSVGEPAATEVPAAEAPDGDRPQEELPAESGASAREQQAGEEEKPGELLIAPAPQAADTQEPAEGSDTGLLGSRTVLLIGGAVVLFALAVLVIAVVILCRRK